MREWQRVPADVLCGLCGQMIPAETPAIYISLENLKRKLVRCASCIGVAPPDLPERMKPGRATSKMQPLKRTAIGMTRERIEAVAAATARMLGERE